MVMLRPARGSFRHVRRPRPVRNALVQTCEPRCLLSAAPVAVDDAYELGADHKLSVDLSTTPPPQAHDEARWAGPTGPFTTPDFVKTVEGGQVVVEPDWVELGERPGTFGEVTVRDPGSRWTVSNWLELGENGKGTITVSDGGALDVRNWTSVGANSGSGGGGTGVVTVTGSGSRWDNRNWVEIGYHNSRGTVRLLDHATLRTGVGLSPQEGGWIEVGDNGFGSLDVLDGSSLTTNQFLVIGDNGGFGNLHVGGGARVHDTNWFTVANNGSRGVAIVDGGGVLSVDNWTENR